MTTQHSYKGLDGGDADVEVRISMRKLAEMVVELNHGAHRFLSHLIDVRRERLALKIKQYRDCGDKNIAASVERRGDPIVDALERVLSEGAY